MCWIDYGCSAFEASNRIFSVEQAKFIREYQRKKKRGIDRLTGDDIKMLSQEIKWSPRRLRDDLAKERRKSRSLIGSAVYLNYKKRTTDSKRPKKNKLLDKNGLSVAWLSVDLIRVDPDYQRALKIRHTSYADEWDWRACGAITVSHRESDGGYYVIDGFQRLNAASLIDALEMLCVIVECSSKSVEADLFCKINIDRSNLNQLEKFWAGYESGSVMYSEIVETCKQNGFGIKRERHPPIGEKGVIKSVGKLIECYKRGGSAALSDLIMVVSESCLDKNSPMLQGFWLGGVSYFIKVAGKKLDYVRLINVLRNMDFDAGRAEASTWQNRAKSTGLGGGGSRFFAMAIGTLYDRRLAKSKKINYNCLGD